jgi:hypothetical protein
MRDSSDVAKEIPLWRPSLRATLLKKTGCENLACPGLGGGGQNNRSYGYLKFSNP